MGDTQPAETGDSRIIGFLPSYLPDSVDTESGTPSHGTVPPLCQSDLLSQDQDPPPYSDLSGYNQNTLSNDPDASSYHEELHPHPSESTDEDAINLCPTKGFQGTVPSVRSVDQIGYRIGLTQIEKNVIWNALSKMRAYALWKSQEDKRNFSRAEDEVLELLQSVKSRLSASEKEEFLKEVRKINQIKAEEEATGHNFADTVLKWCNDPVTIGMKMIEVAMSIVVFVNITEPKRSLDQRLTLIFFEFMGILSTCFLISYWCNPNRSRNVRILDSIFCVVSTIGSGLAGCCASEHWTAIYAFWTMTTYALDSLWKLCQKGICCE